MSGPGRLRDEGREEDRVLLREAIPPVPAGLQERLRGELEARLGVDPRLQRKVGAGAAAGGGRTSARRRFRTWIVVGLGFLGSGMAFALAVPSLREQLGGWVGGDRDREALSSRAPAAQSGPMEEPPGGPAGSPSPSAERPGQDPPGSAAPRATGAGRAGAEDADRSAEGGDERAEDGDWRDDGAGAPADRGRARGGPGSPPSGRAGPSPEERARAVLHPGLRVPPGVPWPGAGSGATGAGDDGEGKPAAPPARPGEPLVILRAGRSSADLRSDGRGVRGRLRGADVDLRLDGALLTGSIGGQPVSLFVRREMARGTIGGESHDFELAPAGEAGILRGSVPTHTVRVELTRAALLIHPGCERPLRRAAPGRYRGSCARGETLELRLPPSFEALPALPRLLVLGLLLTERDPILDAQKPGLFPQRL